MVQQIIKISRGLVMALMFKQCKGFTLAEVLITLGIIGVVAAMTIPTLMNQTNDTQLKVAWKKNYTILNQAFLSLYNDEGGQFNFVNAPNTVAGSDEFRDKLSAYLKYSKSCSAASTKGNCWHIDNNWFYLSNSPYIDAAPRAGLILNDGALVLVELKGAATGGYVVVDVNGFKKPNTMGRDIFWAYSNDKGQLRPTGTAGDFFDTNDSTYGCSASDPAGGYNCAAKYLYQ